MNKLKFLLLFLLISAMLIACTGTKASDKAISAAKSAIEVTDDYLDGKLSYSEANTKLDALKEDMAYVDDLGQEDKNKAADFSISASITVLSTAIFQDNVNNTSKSYDEVVEARNDLAEEAGLDKR